jgi:glycosyltransferase involved in cell wall biosynthesis
MNKKISVVIITLNEEKIISKCLAKLKFADEIIVIDSGSKDKTVEICEKFGALVFYNKFEGYGLQKQFAVSKTKNDWVLALDADEILTDELIYEIPKAINESKEDIEAYLIKRQHVFLNKKFKYGYESRRYFLRLFDKTKGNFNSNVVHEKVSVFGKTQKLKGSFLHYSYESLEDYFTKFNSYTSLYAKSKSKKNKKYSFIEIVLKTIFVFLKIYVLDLNFLNGTEGFFWAYYSSVYTMTKCLKVDEFSFLNKI